ncbi:GNAT family N-acetyltransferase [Amphibacillus cookii]|uniref:GNAT family N-acetyltransferase n=1 Tax=Amphibacillus cookii TaxID=767787 RepID=UPI00195B708C|nr:GNAT family N-acetyltransferase [Amphibacillus cookii]MBM7542908.1 GNAT superfamily N-acetyltransferase [Amphibacillus cookii]
MIRKANPKDIENIMSIVKLVVEVMHAQGSQQWDEAYPTAEDYQRDLSRDELYVFEEEGVIHGVCTISKRGHQEYPLINWSSQQPALTIKRLAVSPSYRGKGVADQFFQFAENLAKSLGRHLNTDTFAHNHFAQRLFQRHGYQFVEARQDPRDLNELHYYEKLLKGEE